MPEEIVRVNEANQKSDRLEKQVATPADFTSPEVLYEAVSYTHLTLPTKLEV